MPLRRFLAALVSRNSDGQSQELIDDPNPYSAIFPGHADIQPKTVETIEWHKLAIKSTYIIFITGRCGSTLLSSLISDTRLAGSPHEFLNPAAASRLNESVQAQTVTNYLERLALSRSFGGFFGFQIDWFQLRYFLSS